MTLIEILYHYRYLVRKSGRASANAFVEGACNKMLWDDIKVSVSDEGQFIDAYRNVYNASAKGDSFSETEFD
jgi:hypothetical protein